MESRFGGGRSPAVAILVTMILLLVGVGYYGSVESLRGAVGGQSIAVLDPVVDLGTIPGGEIHHTQVRIRNLTHGPIRLVGARSTCDCIVPVRVPVVIGAGEVLRLPVSIRAPAVGQFELALARFTERVDEQPQIVIRGSASPAAKLVPESTGEPLAPESDARFTPPQQD